MKMKKWFISFAVMLMAAVVMAPATLAATVQPKVIRPVPQPLCRTVEVTPDHPLFLAGRGRVRAKTYYRSQFYIKAERATTKVEGWGVVALRGQSDDQVTINGWGGKWQLGDWTLYWGTGGVKVRGKAYAVAGFGGFKLTAAGTGKAGFWGRWQVRVCRMNDLPQPLAKPEPLLQFQAE